VIPEKIHQHESERDIRCTDYYAKKSFAFNVEWYILNNDGGRNDFVFSILGWRDSWHGWSTEMAHRGRTASGGKVGIVVRRQGAAVGRVVVEPLLLENSE
jgi:hypothetical protein